MRHVRFLAACALSWFAFACSSASAPGGLAGPDSGAPADLADAAAPGEDAAVAPSCMAPAPSAPPTSRPSRGKSAACTAAELDALFAGTGSGEPSFACRDCVISSRSDTTWGATVEIRDATLFNRGACVLARGESKACADAVNAFTLCQVDSCQSCPQASSDQCFAAAGAQTGRCWALVEDDINACSANFEASMRACAGRAIADFLCGGKAVTPTGCATLVQQGAEVTGVAGAAVPAFSGGTIDDGVWVMTKLEGFGAAGGIAIGKKGKTTLSIKGSAFEQTSVDSVSGKVTTASGALQRASLKLTLDQSCPSAQKLSYSYTATPTSLVMGLGDDPQAPAMVVTYAKK